ncbi:phosphotriesterase family protein [Microbacterium ulmi]|uniref:Phosphotriesterase-related protein n=1 Tax=Microbacterium ulmi TaxID=179095 RepID=A0A7Y2M2J1_9MICO|nr:hypothetical protein [Microbacterium ulmi]NII68935.1 phosphotriesterase-related protein [Microbacterium ulmi]NNH03918.1 hypothetical protein [Microbacterium ulmi]
MPAPVMTVCGPVAADELGVTLIHEHLFADTLREYRSDGLLSDLDLAVRELVGFKAAGGGTVVDVTPATLGRAPELLKRASELAEVHIVMGCGHYRDPYIADTTLDRESVATAARALVAEIRDGVGSTGIRPGIIGEVGSDRAWVSALEERALRAAGVAQVSTGLAITLHAARWQVGRDLVGILDDVGVAADRIVVGHLDTVPDTDYHRELAEHGCWLEFDGFASDVPHETDRQLHGIRRLFDAGHADRVLVSHDLFRLSHFSAYGGVGLTHLLTSVREQALSSGFTVDELDQLLWSNPGRVLAGAA